jgi:hypothetical protein
VLEAVAPLPHASSSSPRRPPRAPTGPGSGLRWAQPGKQPGTARPSTEAEILAAAVVEALALLCSLAGAMAEDEDPGGDGIWGSGEETDIWSTKGGGRIIGLVFGSSV